MTDYLHEAIKAGLVKVDYTAATEPTEYVVTITNGSGQKTAEIVATRASTAAAWGEGWAATLGDGWALKTVEAKDAK